MPRRTATLSLTFVVGACTPDYETEHLRINTHFDAPLCAGNLEWYERMIDQTEQSIGHDLRAPLELELWSSKSWDEGESRHQCGRSEPQGCYEARTHTIQARFDRSVIAHEIVHAFTPRPTSADRMFEEGLSEALTRMTRFGRGRPALATQSGDVDYVSAGHFVRWLAETRGSACLRAVLAVAHADVEATFAESCGSSLDAAIDEYTQTAPWTFPSLLGCDLEAEQVHELAPDQPLALTVEIDCANPSTHSTSAGMHVSHIVRVTAAGNYLSWTNASALTFRRCSTAIEPTPPDSTISDDGVPPASTGLQRAFAGDRVGALRLDAGDYLVGVTMDSWAGVHEVDVRIESAPPITRVP